MKASKAVDEIGVVVHGPEVIDHGYAPITFNLLKKWGSVTAVMGGTMGRVAIIDAHLEDDIDITRREMPSQSVRRLQRSSDAVLLLNLAKSRETGFAFGQMVAANVKSSVPLIQVDFGGGFVAELIGEHKELVQDLSRKLHLKSIFPASIPTNPQVEHRDDLVIRKLVGAREGELISVNGTVIARALKEVVEIQAQNCRIVKIEGAEFKMHGLEKLPCINLETAIVRSGDIRRTENVPRSLNRRGRYLVIIDHAAEETFEIAKGAGVAMTIGDDTTAIAGDVLCRLGIPQIGIVDGDRDWLSHNTTTPPNSTIIRVKPGYDDVVGQRVKAEIFENESRILMDGYSLKSLSEKVKEIAGNELISEIR